MLWSLTTHIRHSILKLRSIGESRNKSLRNDEKKGDCEGNGNNLATRNQEGGIPTVLCLVHTPPRNLHSPAPTASLEHPNSLPPRVATTTTHSLPQLQPSSIPADKPMTLAGGLRLDPMVAVLGLQETESTLTRGTMSVYVGMKGFPCRGGG